MLKYKWSDIPCIFHFSHSINFSTTASMDQTDFYGLELQVDKYPQEPWVAKDCSVSDSFAYVRHCKLLDYLDMIHLDLSSCLSCLVPLWQEAVVIYGRLRCLSAAVVWAWRAVPQIPSREIICFSLCFLAGFGVHSFRLQCTSLALC